jgi:hypothetical protein
MWVNFVFKRQEEFEFCVMWKNVSFFLWAFWIKINPCFKSENSSFGILLSIDVHDLTD